MPLKIKDAPEELKTKWTNVLNDCARQLTQILVEHHHSQIVQQEHLAEKVITKASQEILPEHITNIPNIAKIFEESKLKLRLFIFFCSTRNGPFI